jgi:hypothetical protein
MHRCPAAATDPAGHPLDLLTIVPLAYVEVEMHVLGPPNRHGKYQRINV